MAAKSPARVFRSEIQGVRGFGALYVAAGHCLTRGATGGVGMFFCMTGVLVLATMHADAVSSAPQPTRFLARALSRMVPETLVAVVLTVALTALCLPETLLHATLGDAATFLSSVSICACTAGSVTFPLLTCQTMVSESPACLGNADVSSS